MSEKFTDYYTLLDIEPTATPEQIKSGRRKKLLEGHSDKDPESAAALEFTKQMNAAKAVLLDPVARAKYDAEWKRRRRATTHPPTPAPESRRPTPSATGPRAPAGPPAWPWTPPSPPPSAPSRANTGGLGGLFAGLGGALLLGGLAYVAANANSYDAGVNRYRARDGRFRRGRFF